MQVPRQKQIYVVTCKRRDSTLGANYNLHTGQSDRDVEGVMRDHEASDLRRDRIEKGRRRDQLMLADSTALECQRTRGIDTDYGDLVVEKHRVELVGDVRAISTEWRQKPTHYIIQWYVMIAGDHELRCRHAIEISVRLDELCTRCTLGKIAGHDHTSRRQLPEQLNEWCERGGECRRIGNSS